MPLSSPTPASFLPEDGRADEAMPASREERAERTARLVDELAQCESEAARAEVRRSLVLVNRGVAEAVANRYRRRGLGEEDLVQIAYLGLVKAVERFDPALGHDLLTFAVPTIRGEITRYFRDHGWMVRPPRRAIQLQMAARPVVEELTQELGRQPATAEVAAALDVPAEELDEALDAHGAFTPASLDEPVGEGASTRADLLSTGGDPATDDALQARLRLAPVVRSLDERDRHILYLRFFEQRTQEQIGASLGASQAQVSRRLAQICEDLRAKIA